MEEIARPASPHGLNIVCYDLEIENEIGQVVDGKTLGWNDHALLGISVGVLFDYRTGDYGVYLKEALPELAGRIEKADLVVTFNGIQFDNQLLYACCDEFDAASEGLPNYDILVESRKGAGVDKYSKGFKLDDHLEHTLGRQFMKTGNGAHAPQLWQQGKHSEVITYCLADVRRTCLLFEHVWKWLTIRNSGDPAHPVLDPWRRYLKMEM